mmetsp:Transcript_25920/g.76813  ORF Transcript_25920/g.76813 Transcript_25920/m.76813 type:complete len:231 (+) Transcript_25920:975-1667(+)
MKTSSPAFPNCSSVSLPRWPLSASHDTIWKFFTLNSFTRPLKSSVKPPTDSSHSGRRLASSRAERDRWRGSSCRLAMSSMLLRPSEPSPSSGDHADSGAGSATLMEMGPADDNRSPCGLKLTHSSSRPAPAKPCSRRELPTPPAGASLLGAPVSMYSVPTKLARSLPTTAGSPRRARGGPRPCAGVCSREMTYVDVAAFLVLRADSRNTPPRSRCIWYTLVPKKFRTRLT